MNEQELNNMVETLLHLIEKDFNRDGAFRPTFLLINPARQIRVLSPLKLTGEREKDLTAALIRRTAKEEQALAVLMVMESWMVKAKPGISLDRGTPPSMHPDRIEILMVSVETRFGSACYYWPILRQGKQVRLGFRERHENYGGRFAHLLTGPEDRN